MQEPIAWLQGKLFPSKRENKNEIIAHQWDTLEALWKECRASVTDAAEQGEIDRLFPDASTIWSSDAEAWRRLNYAQQRVGGHLGPTALGVEYQTWLDVARTRNAPSLATYEANQNLFKDPPPNDAKLKQQRAVYIFLMQSLQGVAIETRFRRQLRRETASRLFVVGLIALLIALAPFLLVWMGVGVEKGGPGFAIVVVAALGVLGAYFSRMLSFENKLASIGFDDVMNLYQGRMLALRLLYGMIGSIIFYFVIRAGLLGGGAFPDTARLSEIHPLTEKILAPTADVAKLLIWSFLAGFSERLVPDALARTEAQASKSDKP
jgi:hypothetical protein